MYLEDFLINHKGKKICVVGNARMGHKYGEEIDGYDCVIRFNHYQIDGYSEYCGSRTDLQCLGSPFMDKQHDNCCVVVWKLTKEAVKKNMLVPRKNYCQELIMMLRLSTGMIMLYILHRLNITADVYGFDFFKSIDYYNPFGWNLAYIRHDMFSEEKFAHRLKHRYHDPKENKLMEYRYSKIELMEDVVNQYRDIYKYEPSRLQEDHTKLARLLVPHIDGVKSILDFGCGYSQLTDLMWKSSIQYMNEVRITKFDPAIDIFGDIKHCDVALCINVLDCVPAYGIEHVIRAIRGNSTWAIYRMSIIESRRTLYSGHSITLNKFTRKDWVGILHRFYHDIELIDADRKNIVLKCRRHV